MLYFRGIRFRKVQTDEVTFGITQGHFIGADVCLFVFVSCLRDLLWMTVILFS